MNILFLAKGDKPDYMCDMAYHGLKLSPGVRLEELNPPKFMYSSYADKAKLYGRGFTLYARLPTTPSPVSVWQMWSRIRQRYYDLIIYGSIWRYSHFFELASWHYPMQKILAIDGEDHTRIRKRYALRSAYFKRELIQEVPGVSSINFCIPEEHVLKSAPQKLKDTAHIVPGKRETYIYTNEAVYYQDYRESVFGITTKKGGWDCLRHYEILMNGCIPYFTGIENCPRLTLLDFPKDVVRETNAYREAGKAFDHNARIAALLEYTRTALTTRHLATRLQRFA